MAGWSGAGVRSSERKHIGQPKRSRMNRGQGRDVTSCWFGDGHHEAGLMSTDRARRGAERRVAGVRTGATAAYWRGIWCDSQSEPGSSRRTSAECNLGFRSCRLGLPLRERQRIQEPSVLSGFFPLPQCAPKCRPRLPVPPRRREHAPPAF
ncbi:hypothetical protein VTK56DRAFT_2623 [Thermocarpiscus australiensis]